MGFLKRLFRRKKKSPENGSSATEGSDANIPAPGGGKNRRGRRAANGKGNKKNNKNDEQHHPPPLKGAFFLQHRRRDSPTQPADEQEDPAAVAIPPAAAARVSSPRPTKARGPDVSDGTERPVLGPRLSSSNSSSTTPSLQQQRKRGPGPIDLDETQSYSRGSDLNLSYEEKKTEEYDENMPYSSSTAAAAATQPQGNQKPVFAMPPDAPASKTSPKFTMPESKLPQLRFSAGNVSVSDGDTSNDEESSSFNLSTDAEDNEYEDLRRRLGASAAAPSSNKSSSPTSPPSLLLPQPPQQQQQATTNTDMSVQTLQTNYTTDGESIFPNLQSEDENTITTNSMAEKASAKSILNLPQVDPKTGMSLTPYKNESPVSYKSGSDLQTPLPPDITKKDSTDKPDQPRSRPKPINTSTKNTNNTNSSAPLSASKRDSPERRSRLSPTPKKAPVMPTAFMEAVYGSSPGSEKPKTRDFTTTSSKNRPEVDFSASPKKRPDADFEPFADEPFANSKVASFTSKQPQQQVTSFASKQQQSPSENFANFANFSNFDSEDLFAATENPFAAEKQKTKAVDHLPRKSSSQRNLTSTSSASSAHGETSLSELLKKAKSKSSSGARKTSSSVNSAPAITAAYLRKQHNLKPRNRDGTSVSDIITSLEAANASRGSGPSSTTSGNRHVRTHSRDDPMGSQHSRDGGNSTHSARERLRRRRERQQNNLPHSSDSDGDHEDSESWLMDEVTGALGPRGIAADLESLSGRSNRSNSSRGNRSHKSHRSHRSHKSRNSSTRRRHHRDSGESVDSRGSRHSRESRRSRSSRYSHRSTRSYISQMSEQSRSVANDLLRLEMQLAMVGTGTGGAADTTAGSSSVGGRSQSTRTGVSRSSAGGRRTATARRSRITVTAPPGKLGIILANKADSKGTVVSGVRTSSPLADTITPGDRIVAIDGEDVSLMTVSEITTIMARKSEFDRTLSVLTTPRQTEPPPASMTSPRYRNNYD